MSTQQKELFDKISRAFQKGGNCIFSMIAVDEDLESEKEKYITGASPHQSMIRRLHIANKINALQVENCRIGKLDIDTGSVSITRPSRRALARSNRAASRLTRSRSLSSA